MEKHALIKPKGYTDRPKYILYNFYDMIFRFLIIKMFTFVKNLKIQASPVMSNLKGLRQQFYKIEKGLVIY